MEARINTLSLGAASGDVVFLKNDLKQGMIEVSARFTPIDGISVLLFSEDGGRTWKEIAKNENISVSIKPLLDRPYVPLLRVKTADQQDFVLPFFSNISSIIYKDTDYNGFVAQEIKAMSDDYEKRDTGLFMRHISAGYYGDRSILEEGVRFDFDMFASIRLAIYINRIEKKGALFTADTRWDKTQVPRKTGTEQKSSGKTTITFMLENGNMRVINLRGNLIYATLSPEIAQASGLPQSVVDRISEAREIRNPIQPGAEKVTGGTESGTITLTSPQNGETWTAGDIKNITWTATASVPEVTLTYSTDGGITFPNVIAERISAAAGSYVWPIPNTPGIQVRVKVSNTGDVTVYDNSRTNFTIAAAGSTIESGTFTLFQYTSQPPTLQGFRFDTAQITEEVNFSYSCDVTRREGSIEVKNGNGLIDLGATSLDSISEAPASGYIIGGTGGIFPTPHVGHCYAVKTGSGKYAIVEITALDEMIHKLFFVPPVPISASFRYKYQTNGTRGF